MSKKLNCIVCGAKRSLSNHRYRRLSTVWGDEKAMAEHFKCRSCLGLPNPDVQAVQRLLGQRVISPLYSTQRNKLIEEVLALVKQHGELSAFEKGFCLSIVKRKVKEMEHGSSSNDTHTVG